MILGRTCGLAEEESRGEAGRGRIPRRGQLTETRGVPKPGLSPRRPTVDSRAHEMQSEHLESKPS